LSIPELKISTLLLSGDNRIPVMKFLPDESNIFRTLILIAVVLFLVIALKMTAYIVTIVVISLILTMIAYPAMRYLKRKGMKDIVSVSLVTIVALLLIGLLVAVTVIAFGVFVKDLPLYQAELNQRISDITGLLSSYGIDAVGLSTASIDLQSIVASVVSSLMSIGDLVLYLFFIGVTTFFMLLEAPHVIQRVEKMFRDSPKKLSHLAAMSRYTIEFLVVRTETNLVHGILFGGVLWIMGVHAALLWGILTFMLSYIPYIGLIIAAIPAIIFAWLQFGIWGAVAVIALVCVLNLVVENPVFSYFASRKFEIPALLVILSVIFWGWVLGIAGMVFAVPITLLVLILVQCSDELKWVNVLLGVDRLFREESEKESDPGII
jgi:predicted PurR-regulated permease PerM